MKITYSTLALATLMLCAQAATAQNINRRVVAIHDAGHALEVQTNDGQYVIKPYSTDIVETTFVPNGQAFNPVSHAVVLAPAIVKTSVRQTATAIEYRTAGIVVHITKVPFQISYSYHGKPLTSEQAGYQKSDTAESISFNLDTNEALYGTGARALGMNRRGNRLPLYNKAHYGYEDHSTQMNFSIPLVFSSKMYGIHFDNAPIGTLDLDSKKDNVLSYETISGRKTYQVIAGTSWENIIANYSSLTGRQPLPPRWAFGNFASRFGYHSESEARHIVDEFIRQQIPLDAIIFDLYWFGKDIKGTMGNLEFDRDNFPHPKAMIDDFAAKGVKTVLITEPFILTSSAKWDEAVQKHILATDKNQQPYTYDFYFGHTGLIDIFNPSARTWFWDIYKNLASMGVAGWWGDLGEPEVHPSDLQHATGSADELHNIYGHNWAKLIADGYKANFPTQRPFILMRSGSSGSQRFGMIPWSGDVNRTWGGLQSQPEIALQMGMQGMAYMHSDLGGFAGANLDDELYARWLQYGVFQPIFRPHAQEEVPAEPILRSQTAKDLAKAAIQLRYQLLPYNYTLAYDNNQRGTPLMRPLFFDEPNNKALLGASNEYLWGRDLLVHPVLQAGLKEAQIYFPARNNWFDFYTDQIYQAGTTQTVALTSDHIPVFVRAGAFIPMIDVIQNTSQYSTQKINLHYYFDAAVTASNGHMYDDDGTNPNAIEQGKFALIDFKSTLKQQQLAIDIGVTNGANHPALDRVVALSIHHLMKKPSKILVQRKPVEFEWDAIKKVVSVRVPINQSTPVRVSVQLAGINAS
ncbi:glycoside hydrolase family 31 protein [Sapientia aquatica]|uniref:DUF4968 domain-containing protein n=1 Tax=Sapientia aquatica TaxID=1549640 RepID=A0A4R5VSQ4_9BURK|nr:TIM-barrel domain-containing protein [Sapientia aquatica]TDK61914.1 DUF4968 domain-containing protein [Sapientia aquatica]